MPAVTILPSSPALRDFGPSSITTANGSGSGAGVGAGGPSDDTVAEIKERVRAGVQALRGASALSLLRTARDQAIHGRGLEEAGDLRGAFRCLLTASRLTQAVIEHSEFRQEKDGKKGVVWKDLLDFQQHYGNAAVSKAKNLEAKLLELEKNRGPEVKIDGPVHKPGGSIADRMRSLQDAGLSVQTTKRLSRDLSVNPPAADWKSSSMSRTSPSQNHNGSHSHSQSQSQAVTDHPTGSSVHSFVSPSSLGPPSPSSSTASSPRLSHFTLNEFNQTFPSIDELDESMHALPALPSVPTHIPGTASRSPLPSPSVIKRFPSIPLDLDPGPRPASTPIPPTMNALQSRPASPSPANPFRTPLSPTVPPKSPSLNISMTGGSSARTSPSHSSPVNTGDSQRSRGVDLPVTNTIHPKMLHGYMERPNEVKVLLLDIRTRDEFAKAHIRGDAVVCLEPHVLLRDGLTCEKLEDALSVAPQRESALFRNRDKFDLVVLYDTDSESFGSSIAPMSAAVRIIYETVFRCMLKRPPIILVGGLKAWCAAFPNEVARADGTLSLELDIEHMKLTPSSPAVNGATFYSNGSPSQDARSPTLASRSSYTMNQILEDESSAADVNNSSSPEITRRLVRKPVMSRPPSSSSISFNIRGLYDNQSPPYLNGSHAASSSSIVYPQYPRSTSSFGASLPSVSAQAGLASPPPTASINPTTLSRRRSDYIDQSEQAVSTFASRPSIDYPDLSAQHVVRPLPVAATPLSERQDRRKSSHGHRSSLSVLDVPRPPMINSDYPVVYWPDTQFATSGLKNLGNTCYMNSTMQCLSATVPFARFFTDGRWKSAVNMLNPLGSKGQLTSAFASILHDLWHQESPIITPYAFRKSICMYAKQFAGSEQHDSQEFLNFLLDELHEDLNRILKKQPIEVTPEREAELEVLPQQIASQQEWNICRMRDDSIVADFFQGQFRNRMECLTCRKTSTTYNTFMCLSLPIQHVRGSRATLRQCLDAFVQEEVMEKADAWQCPNCKQLRKATKRLSISRLPPVLVIQLKRFTTKGHFTDKLETFVDFPLKGLDLTNYMPPPLPPGTERKPSAPISLDDPRSQIPPYRYDLYAVTNHFGTLSSGHYTAFINSRGNWLYCDDSRIAAADAREVVGKPAYVLYYKRVKS